MVKDKLKKIRNGFKSGRWEYLLYAATSGLPGWLLKYHHTFLFKATDVKLITREYKDYTIRFATEEDAGRFAEVESDKEKALHRLKRGDSCAIVEKDGRVVSISWVAHGKLYNKIAGSIIDTGDDGMVLFGVYSVPEERLKGFFPSCFKMQCEQYSAQGRNVKYAVVEILNRNSLRLHKKLGFKTVGETYYIAFLGISVCYYKYWAYKTPKFHIFFRRPPSNMEWV